MQRTEIEELEHKLKVEREHGKAGWRVATALAALAGLDTSGREGSVYDLIVREAFRQVKGE
jgi:hypothetical protein